MAARRHQTIPQATRVIDLSRDDVFDVSVVLPCLDEAATIARCVETALCVIKDSGMTGEVVVVDNGSSDGSAVLATAAGARVVHEDARGYGRACLTGFREARGRYIVMADADGTYPLEEIPRFIGQLRNGADFAVGSRLRGTIEKGAMPLLHRYVGNPFLSRLLGRFLRVEVSDILCGMRAFRRDALPALTLRTTGMELCPEMIIGAAQSGLTIVEIPIAYHAREGHSKLHTVRDGWHNLRLLLMHSPTWLFTIPGAFMVGLGFLLAVTVLAKLRVFGRVWQLHPLIAGSMFVIVGIQVLALGICARAGRAYLTSDERASSKRLFKWFDLKYAGPAGMCLTAAGLSLGAFIGVKWARRGFGALSEQHLAIVAATLVVVGIQVFFSSFLLSILTWQRPREDVRPAVGEHQS